MEYASVYFQLPHAQQSRAAGYGAIPQVARCLERARHESVPQPAYPSKRRRYIDREAFCSPDTEFVEAGAAVKGIRRFDQCLGGHAAYSRADCAPWPMIDDDEIIRTLPDFPQGGKPGRSGSDNNDVIVFAHGFPWSLVTYFIVNQLV
jgi:hypothetical protein